MGKAVAGFLVLAGMAVAAAGCLGGINLRQEPERLHPGPAAVRRTLATRQEPVWLPWPAVETIQDTPGERWEWPALEEYGLLVLDLRSRGLPAAAARAPVAAAVRRWVEGGGRLLLLGYAPKWLETLGLVEKGTVKSWLFRGGFTDRSVSGHYRWGIQAVPGRARSPLFAGLTPEAGSRDRFNLGAGAPLTLELALVPRGGERLADLVRHHAGRTRTLAGAVVTWPAGKGRILGVGIGLDPQGSGPAAANRKRLLLNAYDSLRPRRGRIGWLVGPDPSPRHDASLVARRPGTRAPWWEGELPRPRALTHWGVRARLHGWNGAGTPATPAEVVAAAERLWGRGADLLELDLWVPGAGYPLPWPPRDPLARPAGYQGQARVAGWTGRGFAELLRPLHHLDMLVQPWFSMPPIHPLATPADREALALAGRRLWRDLFDRRLAGPELAFDGLGLGIWPGDGQGGLLATLWHHHPGAYVHTAVTHHRHAPSISRTVNGQFGRIPGIEAGGLAEGWRWDSPPPLYLSAAADCRQHLPAGPDPDGTLAGQGAWPDWILAQVGDFVRGRGDRESLLVWLGKHKGRLSPRTDHFVEAVSAYPVEGAFAARLSATGRGGWREQARRWVAGAQAGFGALDERPCRTAFIQNAHLRLYGTGSSLMLDPTHRARFPRRGEKVRLAQVLSGSFFRTTLKSPGVDAQDVRPWSAARAASRLAPFRVAGPWGAQATVNLEPGLTEPVPARLAGRSGLGWPTALRVVATAPPGLYRLRFAANATAGPGMVRVQLGDEPLAFAAYARKGEAILLEVEVPHPDPATLRLDLVVEGAGELILQSIALDRIRDQATAVRIVEPGGPRAVLEERFVSGPLRETRRLTVHAGLPALTLDVQIHRVRGRFRVERTVILTDHDLLLRGPRRTTRGAVHGEDDAGRRYPEGPWILRDTSRRLPDLAVVPLRRTANQRLHWKPGFGLTLVDRPASGSRFAIAFLLPRGEVRPEDLHKLRLAFTDEVLRLPGATLRGGVAARLPSPWPFPWPRVVEFATALPSPLLVREKGWWIGAAAVPTWESGRKRSVGLVRLTPGSEGAVRVGRRGRFQGGAGLLFGRLVPPTLPDGWRPGRGCSRLLAIRARRGQPEAEVAVLRSGPFVFAPALGRPQPITGATLDGRPWSYWEGDQLLLPRRRGRFRVTVLHGGAPAPHLAATAARIESCRWHRDLGLLKFTAHHPEGYEGDLPGRGRYGFLVRTAGRRVAKVEGARVVPEGALGLPRLRGVAAAAEGVVLTGGPGTVKVWLEPEGGR